MSSTNTVPAAPEKATAAKEFKKIVIEIDAKNPTFDGVTIKVDGVVVENLASFSMYGYRERNEKGEVYYHSFNCDYSVEDPVKKAGTIAERTYYRITPNVQRCCASVENVPFIKEHAPKTDASLRLAFAAIGCGPSIR